jgi:hypothetical protein
MEPIHSRDRARHGRRACATARNHGETVSSVTLTATSMPRAAALDAVVRRVREGSERAASDAPDRQTDKLAKSSSTAAMSC